MSVLRLFRMHVPPQKTVLNWNAGNYKFAVQQGRSYCLKEAGFVSLLHYTRENGAQWLKR
jgi:hypothetical protein